MVIFENTEVKEIKANEKCVLIDLECEQIRANKVIVTAGRWLGELLPSLKNLLVPVKQHFLQIEMKNPSEFKIGRFPSFQLNRTGFGEYYLLP